ncbi:response regulator receiver protein [Candidatus Tenderia electrophaga]|jgi:diguanylate cyclase (GGDEF)-like protein/PAS domain S-box-containing protein|uniref:cyclic-guanylate-specific phosphodiesterase n=1 Tax=Candidatus Tenderia electrophaga TaxID=1748243 RepID=A0A0S2TAR8_9GAMM|nr:response regulator receiver protein [Candidatus Tenderia electrophaga]
MKHPQEKPDTETVRILMAEDSEDDALLLAAHLKTAGANIDWYRVDKQETLEAALTQPWDIVLSDFSMPSFSGIRALAITKQHDPDLPLIFVSGTIGEDTAVEAMRSGAQDYIMKDNLTRLLPAVNREIHEFRLRRERRQVQETVKKLSLVVEQAADSVFITDPDGHIQYVNPAFEQLTGYTRAEAVGRRPSLLKSGRHNEAFYRALWSTVRRGEAFEGVMINRRKNGELFYEEKVITSLKDGRGEITHLVSTGRDITERILADEEHSRLVTILEATTDLVAMFEPGGRLCYINAAGRDMLALEGEKDVREYRVKDIFPRHLVDNIMQEIMHTTHKPEPWAGETVLHSTQGREIPVSQVMLVHANESGTVEYLSMIARDITERKRFEAELQHQATHDGLTKLPNRFLLMDRLQAELKGAKRRRRFVAIMFIDLDNFKRVNDSFGHAAGDELLQLVARRLQSVLRPNDTIARHGGDEFTILVADLEQVDAVLAVLRKLRAAFERPLMIENQDIFVTFSAGIAVFPHDGSRVEDLLRNADSAMYRAKAAGRGQYRFYTREMNDRGHELLALETDLRRALERDEFRLHFQPQMELTSRRAVGIEALIRWQHPQRGLIPPAEFVPMLESTGLIIAVGEWALRQACVQHRDGCHNGLRVSVNISASQFSDPDLLDKVRRVLAEEGMPPERLELEITENTIMHDPAAAAEQLQALHAMGIRIAIDDFGTGYSSLAYLKRFPLDVLKIDQTFVRDITHDPNDAAIVEASISLAQKLGLEVIAEGVENAAQFDFLRASQCNLAQGFFFGKPVPMEELAE